MNTPIFQIGYWLIVAILATILVAMYIDVYLKEKRNEKVIKSIPKGSYIYIIYAGKPTKVLLVHHNENSLTCRLHGQIIEVNYDQVILNIN